MNIVREIFTYTDDIMDMFHFINYRGKIIIEGHITDEFLEEAKDKKDVLQILTEYWQPYYCSMKYH